jgi:hypothetical protein
MPLLPDGTPAFQYVWDHLFAFAAAPTVPAASAAPRALLLGLIVASGLWLAKIPGRSGEGERR